MNKETVLEALARSLTLESALQMLDYSMEFMNYIDNNENELRKIACHIAGGIECLQEYQDKTTGIIEKLRHEIETEEPEQDPDRADEVKNLDLDYEKIGKAALDTDRARATIGCLILALHDQGGDNAITKINETTCWQLRASLEVVYKILEETALVFFETSELIEKLKDEENQNV